jgi:hypothetical protein
MDTRPILEALRSVGIPFASPPLPADELGAGIASLRGERAPSELLYEAENVRPFVRTLATIAAAHTIDLERAGTLGRLCAQFARAFPAGSRIEIANVVQAALDSIDHESLDALSARVGVSAEWLKRLPRHLAIDVDVHSDGESLHVTHRTQGTTMKVDFSTPPDPPNAIAAMAGIPLEVRSRAGRQLFTCVQSAERHFDRHRFEIKDGALTPLAGADPWTAAIVALGISTLISASVIAFCGNDNEPGEPAPENPSELGRVLCGTGKYFAVVSALVAAGLALVPLGIVGAGFAIGFAGFFAVKALQT